MFRKKDSPEVSGVNVTLVKDMNRSVILQTLMRLGMATKMELSRSSGLSFPTASKLVSELEKTGLVEFVSLGESDGGRPPNVYRFNPRAGAILAIEIQETGVNALATDLIGTPELDRTEILRVGYPGKILPEAILTAIDRVIANVKSRIMRISVATPGIIDQATGTVIRAVNLGWSNVPLKKLLEDKFEVITIVENDAIASAVGEWYYGKHDKVNNMAYVIVGHGVGAGFVIGGEPFRGAHYKAGALGHTVIERNGPVCKCGKRGCLEAVVAQSLSPIREATPRTSDTLGRGHRMARVPEDTGNPEEWTVLPDSILQKVGSDLAIGIGNLIELLDPELIVVGGEVALKPGFMRALQEALNRTSYSFSNVQIQGSSLYPDANLKGAVALAIRDMFGVPELRPLHLERT